MSIDRKGRTVLNEKALSMVSLVVATNRDAMNHEGILEARKCVEEVTQAYTTMGWVVVKQSWIDEIKKGILEHDL